MKEGIKFSLYKETCLKAIEVSNSICELQNYIRDRLGDFEIEVGNDLRIRHDGCTVKTVWVVKSFVKKFDWDWILVEIFQFTPNTWCNKNNFELSKIRFIKHIDRIEEAYWKSRKRALLNALYPHQWWNPKRCEFRKRNVPFYN